MATPEVDNPTGKPVPVPNPKVATLVRSDESRQVILSWLRGDDLDDEPDNEDITVAEAYRILNAETPEAALDNPTPLKGEDLVDTNFTILSVAWRRSTKKGAGNGRYAVMECVDSNGEPFIATCGATDVILKLKRAEVADPSWFPWTVTMEAQTTETGNTMFRLAVPGADF